MKYKDLYPIWIALLIVSFLVAYIFKTVIITFCVASLIAIHQTIDIIYFDKHQ